MKKILVAVATLTVLVFLACHLSPVDSETTINVEGDSTWVSYDSLKIFLQDTNGVILDKLFGEKLKSLAQLNGLSAAKYDGGEAVFHIQGYRGDTLVFEQNRRFSDKTGLAVVETTLVLGLPVKTLSIAPESLTLYLGGEEGLVKVSGTPVFAKPELEWSATGDALDMVVKAGAWTTKLNPKKEGTATISVHPKNNPSLEKNMVVRVVKDAPVLEVTPLKSYVTVGTKVVFTVKSHQAYGTLVDYRWDVDGDGTWDDSLSGPWTDLAADLPSQSHTYATAGSYTVRFHVRDGEGNEVEAQALVEVGERKPSVTLAPKDTVISIKDAVYFRGNIMESGGKLASYSWDFNGDGKPEESASLSDSTATLGISHTFPDSGTFIVIFRSLDAAGKSGADSVTVNVLIDAPVVNAGQDTTAKSRAGISFQGTATQRFGTVVMYKWDYNGDGNYDDSSASPMAKTYAYPLEGVYKARFYVRDDDGNVTTGIRTITISDAPFLILSKHADTTISIKDSILLTASVRNDDAKSLQYGWDYDGDGNLDDTSSSSLSTLNISIGHRYNAPGLFKTVLHVKDLGGKVLTDTVTVAVLLDPPKANLGKDTSLLVGTPLKVSLAATDRFGAIVKRELDIGGTGHYLALSQQDTIITLPAIKGRLRLIGQVTDDDGQVGLDTMDVNVIYSPENKLASLFLSPSGITLSPDFSPDSLAYATTVANAINNVSIGAAAQNTSASITVNGFPLSKSVLSVSVNLNSGMNAIPIVVTAQDSTIRTYTLNFKRLPSTNANLAAITTTPAVTIAPTFSPDIQTYGASVVNTVTSIKIGGTTQDKSSKLTVNGSAVSDTGSVSVNLAMGSNSVSISVTAEDLSVRTYTLMLTRAPSSNANLASLATTPAGGLFPAFLPTTLAYTLTLPDSVDSVQVTPKVVDATAKITVNGLTAVSGVISPRIPAPIGTSTVTVNVTAQDNTTLKSYVITIKRPGWQLAGSALFSPARTSFQAMVQDKGTIYAAFTDSNNQYRPLVMRKDSTGWTALSSIGLPDSAATNLKLLVHSGVLYLGFNAVGGGFYPAVYVRKYNGSSWSTVGKTYTIGPVGIDAFDLDFDTKDTMYFSIPVYYISKNTSLFKFNGTDWIYYAATNSTDSATSTLMAVNPSTGTTGFAWVKRNAVTLNGVAMIDTLGKTTPTMVGADTVAKSVFLPLGASGWQVGPGPIAYELDPSGIPYYVYADPIGKKIAVRKFTGTWTLLGMEGFSDGPATGFKISFLGSTPVVAYRDGNLKTIVVKQWNGTSWIPLGNQPITADDVNSLDLAASGTSAWVGFGDATGGNRGTVEARILP